ncbi:hypothetical protein MMC21_007874, partial [Puttea exsequens]|nr:hypothetical protein [Puttea exsequens]
STKNFDLNTTTSGIANQTVVILGCKVQGSGKEVKDPNNPRTYITTSTKTVVSTYLQNQSFVVDPAPSLGLDAVAFQDAFLNINNPAIAKLLVAVANLISPEVA